MNKYQEYLLSHIKDIETDYTEFYIQRQQPPIIDQGNIVVI